MTEMSQRKENSLTQSNILGNSTRPFTWVATVVNFFSLDTHLYASVRLVPPRPDPTSSAPIKAGLATKMDATYDQPPSSSSSSVSWHRHTAAVFFDELIGVLFIGTCCTCALRCVGHYVFAQNSSTSCGFEFYFLLTRISFGDFFTGNVFTRASLVVSVVPRIDAACWSSLRVWV